MTQLLPPPLFRLALLLELLIHSSTGVWAQSASYQVPLGQAAAYGLLSSGSIVAQDASGNPLPIQTLGKAGASGTIGSGITASAGVFAQGSGTVPLALSSLISARNYCTSQSSVNLDANLSSRTLSGGSYTVPGNANLSSGGILTLTGDTATVIILNIAGSLTVGSQARVKLVGVLPRHVYWNLSGSLNVADQAGFWGVVLLSAGTTATLNGYQFGTCALLSGGSVALYGLSAEVGYNKFDAPARIASVCNDPNTPSYPAPSCAFTRPGSELIMDGSFEQRRCCVNQGSGIDYYLSNSLACFWQSPTGGGNPEYFNTCVSAPGAFTNPYVGIPVNIFTPAAGTQHPVPALAQNSQATTGEGYAGIYAAYPAIPNYREYVYQEIPGSLTAGRRYYAEFSAHLAPASSYVVTNLGMLVAPASLPYPDISSSTLRWSGNSGQNRVLSFLRHERQPSTY